MQLLVSPSGSSSHVTPAAVSRSEDAQHQASRPKLISRPLSSHCASLDHPTFEKQVQGRKVGEGHKEHLTQRQSVFPCRANLLHFHHHEYELPSRGPLPLNTCSGRHGVSCKEGAIWPLLNVSNRQFDTVSPAEKASCIVQTEGGISEHAAILLTPNRLVSQPQPPSSPLAQTQTLNFSSCNVLSERLAQHHAGMKWQQSSCDSCGGEKVSSGYPVCRWTIRYPGVSHESELGSV